jgi:hypothetical protein
MRATCATLLGLQLEQVPHFMLFDNGVWEKVWREYYGIFGYTYTGSYYFSETPPLYSQSIDGYYEAVVPSHTYGGKTLHAIVINQDGICVHDPNPNKFYQDKDLRFLGRKLIYYAFTKKEINK